jgi:hypothetical protein
MAIKKLLLRFAQDLTYSRSHVKRGGGKSEHLLRIGVSPIRLVLSVLTKAIISCSSLPLT